ncbi:hypothetical protein BHYA_0190g00270 [Botrytis hyacinthi]|uniref:Uncharacterized protein n=1 Tax=Botrytis hyacinthi TaxID=278943 RepID=A0A4Z1GHK5_9HELO|nr:hypothetical protein BHYA_0190g00270 [Botrytis hyacinthi]
MGSQNRKLANCSITSTNSRPRNAIIVGLGRIDKLTAYTTAARSTSPKALVYPTGRVHEV